MSLYENYAQTAGHYDSTRSATGSEIWLGHLISHFGDLRGVRLLDAGCGTGNYALEMARHVGQVTALDMNQQMLAKARTKAAAVPHGDRIEFRHGQLLDLPFADASFDAVMFNQSAAPSGLGPAEAGFPGYRGAPTAGRAGAAPGRRGFRQYQFAVPDAAWLLVCVADPRGARPGDRTDHFVARAAPRPAKRPGSVMRRALYRSTRCYSARLLLTEKARSTPAGGPAIRSGRWLRRTSLPGRSRRSAGCGDQERGKSTCASTTATGPMSAS